MEIPAETSQPTPSTPKVTRGQVPKKLYLVVFVGILLTIVALSLYFFLVASKGTNKKTEAESTTTTATLSAKKEPEKNYDKVYVTAAEGLNLREEASTSSLVVLLLPVGTELKVISTQGDWYFVEAQTKGFVNKEFVSSSKPATGTLLTFTNSDSPFKFLYPDLYTIKLSNDDQSKTYSFTGNDSYGGFKVVSEDNFATLGNYAIKNYPQAQKTSCEPVRFGTQAKECEKVTDETGSTYLLLVNTTLYKITYLKTEGGLLTDLNNLIFYSMYFD